jgi:phosphonate transport system substrate-binding protein
MEVLRLTSCMAENADAFCRGVAAYLGDRLGIATELVEHVSWAERERLFDEGAVDVAWLCGLPYAWKADDGGRDVEILAAPVMAAARYGGRAVYFSDVVVRSDSRFRRFEDLRGSVWAYNERRSHSGAGVVRAHLATLGEDGRFFGVVVESGAHQCSIERIVSGEVDASAIDSTVLELEIARRPELDRLLRVIEVLGPSPMPPWVVHRRLPANLRDAVREALLRMHEDASGREALACGRAARFVRASDRDYDAVRQTARLADAVPL